MPEIYKTAQLVSLQWLTFGPGRGIVVCCDKIAADVGAGLLHFCNNPEGLREGRVLSRSTWGSGRSSGRLFRERAGQEKVQQLACLGGHFGRAAR